MQYLFCKIGLKLGVIKFINTPQNFNLENIEQKKKEYSNTARNSKGKKAFYETA